MAELVKGRNVRVEVGYTEGAAIPVSDVTQTNPAIAQATAHGLTVGSVGYFNDVENMDPLDGQAVRVADGGSPSANAFALETLDASEFTDYTAGEFVPITQWATLSQSTSYQLGGGAPRTEDVGTLIDTTEKLETIKLAAETVTIDVRSLTEDNQALGKIRAVARAAGRLVFRITLADGAQRLFRGQPSIPGESLTQGATGTGQLTVTVRGQILYLPALA
jgi:hypothetical protein